MGVYPQAVCCLVWVGYAFHSLIHCRCNTPSGTYKTDVYAGKKTREVNFYYNCLRMWMLLVVATASMLAWACLPLILTAFQRGKENAEVRDTSWPVFASWNGLWFLEFFLTLLAVTHCISEQWHNNMRKISLVSLSLYFSLCIFTQSPAEGWQKYSCVV